MSEECTASLSSPSSSSLSSPSNLLDNLLQGYEENINNEIRLINEVHYEINQNISLSTGLSAVRGYMPAVRIFDRRLIKKKQANISLILSEWNELLTHHGLLNYHITSKSAWNCGRCREDKAEVLNREVTMGFIKLKYLYVKNTMHPAIKIKRSNMELILNTKDIDKLMKMFDLITMRLERLEQLNFPHYYDTVLNMVRNNKENACIYDIEVYVTRMLLRQKKQEMDTIWTSEYIDCMLEILSFELPKFKDLKSVECFLRKLCSVCI